MAIWAWPSIESNKTHFRRNPSWSKSARLNLLTIWWLGRFYGVLTMLSLCPFVEGPEFWLGTPPRCPKTLRWRQCHLHSCEKYSADWRCRLLTELELERENLILLLFGNEQNSCLEVRRTVGSRIFSAMNLVPYHEPMPDFHGFSRPASHPWHVPPWHRYAIQLVNNLQIHAWEQF